MVDKKKFNLQKLLSGGGSACGKASDLSEKQPKLLRPGQNEPDSDEENQDEANQGQRKGMKAVARELGKGAFGSVVEVIDLETGEITAEKKFAKQNGFEEEKHIYDELNSSYSGDQKKLLNSLSILPSHYDMPLKTIHFAVGQASLMDLKKSEIFQFNSQHLVHLFTRMLNFILVLKDKGYCHSDLKPENVTLVRVTDNLYEARIIDFGELTKNQLQPTGCTPNYFNHPLREYDQDGRIKFKSMEERFKNEFYTIVRTLMRLIVTERKVDSEFQISSTLKPEQQVEQLQKLVNQLGQIDQGKNAELQIITKFLINDAFTEKYTLQDLQKLLENLKSQKDFSKQYDHFIDTQNFIAKMVTAKRQEVEGRESAISQLFGLKSFVRQKGSTTNEYANNFDLLNYLSDQLFDSAQRKNTVLFGESGSGKSLFLIKLIQKINNDQRFKNFEVVYFKLRELSGEGSSKALLKLAQEVKSHVGEEQQSKKPILLFLDGFDELNNKEIAVNETLQQQFDGRVTIVVSSRLRYATYSEFRACFGAHQELYVCPFDEEQRHKYVRNSVKVFKTLKNKITEFETYETAEKYIEVLNQQQNIQQLAQVPFTLSLIITILPKLKKLSSSEAFKNKLTDKVTRYDVYEIFSQQYIDSELKRALLIDQQKEALYEHYELNSFADFLKEEEQLEQFLQDLKIFHQLSCWKMLQKQKLKLQQSDIDEVTDQAQLAYDKNLSDIAFVLAKIAPVQSTSNGELQYVHKSVYEFYIAQSVIVETLQAQQQPIQEKSTVLNQGFLALDLDILGTVGEQINELPAEDQYLKFFQTWYKSILLTKRIKSENIKDDQEILKLERIGSNCINLLSALPSCDLRKRDFTDCAIPNAYFYKQDLTGSNFTNAQLRNSVIADARLNNCQFVNTDLSNVKYGRFPDLKGHRDRVFRIAFTFDSKILASGGGGGTIKLWNLETLQELATLEGHEGIIWSVNFSPDGQQLASAGDDKTIKLWNVQSQQLITSLEGHSAQVKSVQFSPDGKYFASGSEDTTIKLWSVQTQKEVATLSGHTLRVWQVVFSADSKFLVSGSQDKTAKVWSVDEQKVLATLEGHQGEVNSVALTPDGKQLLTGSEDKTIRLWSLETYKEVVALEGHTGVVLSVAFSSDGKLMASGSADKMLKVWSVDTQKELATLKGHSERVYSVEFSQNGKYLGSGSLDNTIKLWSVEQQKELVQLQGHLQFVRTVAFAPDGNTFASGSADTTIKIWSIETKREIATLKGHSKEVFSVAYSSDRKYLASGSGDQTIKLWNIENQKEITTLKGHSGIIFQVVFSPDSKLLASASNDKTIKVWSVEDQKELSTLKNDSGMVFSIAFSPDGKNLASTGEDKTVKMWALEGFKLSATLQRHSEWIRSVAYSPDGKLLASGGQDDKIKLWSTELQKEIATLSGHKNSVWNVAISPDGKYLMSAGWDNAIKIWSIESKTELATLEGHVSYIYSLSFSSNGNYLISSDFDCAIKLWYIEYQDQQKQSDAQNQQLAFPTWPPRKINAQKIVPAITQISNVFNFSKNNRSFECERAIFSGCRFQTQQEAEIAGKVFYQYNCRTFDNPKQ